MIDIDTVTSSAIRLTTKRAVEVVLARLSIPAVNEYHGDGDAIDCDGPGGPGGPGDGHCGGKQRRGRRAGGGSGGHGGCGRDGDVSSRDGGVDRLRCGVPGGVTGCGVCDMSVTVWLDNDGVVGGLNLLRYSRAGRYDRGVASRARQVSCTRRLSTPTKAFLPARFAGLGRFGDGAGDGGAVVRGPGTAGITALDGDGAGTPVRWVAHDGRPTATSLDDERRDVVAVTAGGAAGLAAIWGRDVVIGVGRLGEGGKLGRLVGDALGVIAVVVV